VKAEILASFGRLAGLIVILFHLAPMLLRAANYDSGGLLSRIVVTTSFVENLLPRQTEPIPNDWFSLVTLDINALPLIDLTNFNGSLARSAESAVNVQDLATWEREAVIIAASERRIVWHQPSRHEGPENPAEVTEEIFVGPEAPLERLPRADDEIKAIQGGRDRGVILHKLLEEVLTRETNENWPLSKHEPPNSSHNWGSWIRKMPPVVSQASRWRPLSIVRSCFRMLPHFAHAFSLHSGFMLASRQVKTCRSPLASPTRSLPTTTEGSKRSSTGRAMSIPRLARSKSIVHKYAIISRRLERSSGLSCF